MIAPVIHFYTLKKDKATNIFLWNSGSLGFKGLEESYSSGISAICQSGILV